MHEEHQFLAEVLRQSTRALSGYTAQSLVEKHPEAAHGFAPDGFAGWRGWLSARLEDLAAAAATAHPELFVGQVQWGRVLLDARGVPPEHFFHSLECLKDVLVEELPLPARVIAGDYLDQALDAYDQPSPLLSNRLLPDTELGRLSSTYLLVLLEGDRRRANQLILDAIDAGQSIPDIYRGVLLPAQEELGRMWLLNEISIAEEHFASQTTKRIMAQLLPRATLAPANGKVFLGASVAGNQHDIGLEAVCDFFEMDGWRSILLGASVPVADLADALGTFQVDLLGLSVALATHFDMAQKTIEAVRATPHGENVKILLGGRPGLVSAELADELGADGHAVGLAEAVAVGRSLVDID